jgi:hypothetical protein
MSNFYSLEICQHTKRNECVFKYLLKNKDKAVPVEARTGREGSRKLKLPDLKTVG